MAGKAAALRKIGLKAHLFYLIGAALALLNLLWFGRWMIEKTTAYPDAAALWLYAIMCVSMAGFFITRPVYGYIRVPSIIWSIFILGVLGGAIGFTIRGLQTGFIDPAQIITSYALPVAALSAVFAFLMALVKNRGQKNGLSGFGDAVTQYGAWCAGLAALLVLVFSAPSPLIYVAAAVFVPTFIFIAPVTLFAVKEYVKEAPLYRERLGSTGSGGAARFGGFYWYAKLDADNIGRRPQGARHYIGSTTFETDPRIGGREIYLDTDNHLMTVAAIGAGKSYYSAWNVLPEWKGGAFILDPKGEHAKAMGGARQKFGRVVFFDPWGLGDEPSATFNPLEEIDTASPNARDDLMQIVKACIHSADKESGTSAHFRESAETLFLGIMAHVLTTREPQYHNLPSIYDTFLMGDADYGAASPQDFDDLIADMAMNAAMGKAPMEAAKIMMTAGDRERGAVITTLNRHLKWVNTPSIRPKLMKSSFRMREIKRDKATVFCMIPMEHLSHHARLTRVIVALGLLSCREDVEHNERALFCLDEFAQLGTFIPVRNGLVTMRSWGLKIWMFFQDIGQLRELYDNSDSFLNSCDKQFFGITSFETSKLVSDMCGDYLERWTEGADNAPRYQERARNLRSSADIQEELRKESGLQYVFPANTSAPLRLKLVPFNRRNGQLPSYDGQKVDAHSIAEQRRAQHEESKNSGLISYWQNTLEIEPEKRQEAISELKRLGGEIPEAYRPARPRKAAQEPETAKAGKSEPEAQKRPVKATGKVDGRSVQDAVQKGYDDALERMRAEQMARPRSAEEQAELDDYNDLKIRQFWEHSMEGYDYAGFYDRHGHSLSKEELEQLSKHIAEQERRESKKPGNE